MSTQSVVSQVVRNIVAIADVIVHAGEVQQNVDNMAKMLLVTGWIVTYSYAFEMISAWHSNDPFERYVHLEARPFALAGFALMIALINSWLFSTILFGAKLTRPIDA